MKTWLSCVLLEGCVCVFAVGALAQDNAVAPASPQPQTPTVQVTAPKPDLSYSANEVLKLHRNGISDEVVKAFVQASPYKYQLNAEGVVYLSQQGIPLPVITSMLRRDKELAASAPAPVQTTQTAPAAAQGSVAPVQVESAPPTVVSVPQVVTYPYEVPVPVYSYPYYSYPYYGYGYSSFGYYGPSISIGFGSRGGFHRGGLGYGGYGHYGSGFYGRGHFGGSVGFSGHGGRGGGFGHR